MFGLDQKTGNGTRSTCHVVDAAPQLFVEVRHN